MTKNDFKLSLSNPWVLGAAVVGIIVIGLHLGWFHDLIHIGEKPGDISSYDKRAMYGDYY
jgi:F0F1-type ATP synthase assembly protein I